MLGNIFRSNTTLLPYIQIILTLTSAVGLVLMFSWEGVILSVVMYFLIGCLGISIGYHRYLSHKSFELKYKWMQWPLLFLGCLAGTGSPIGWVAVHREHHRHSDREHDPHSPHTIGLKSFIAKYHYQWNKWPIRDLIVDPIHRYIHDYYFALLVVYFIALAIIDPMLLLYIGIIPMVLSIWASTISNYINHKYGYRNYNTIDKSGNCWYTALLTFGEGWHNNHHARPKDFRFGRKWWEFDIGAIIIAGLMKTKY